MEFTVLKEREFTRADKSRKLSEGLQPLRDLPSA